MAQSSPAGGRQGDAGDPTISWVAQYPEVKAPVKQKAFGKVYDFLVKKNKKQGLVRPVGVLAKNPDDFIVLDQACQTIFAVEDKKSEVLKCIRKKDNYFTSLVSICALSDGNFLFTDSRLNNVFEVSEDQRKFVPLNDTLQLQQPTGIAYAPATGEIWVVETGAHRIAILDRHGNLLRRIGGRGSEEGLFNYPTSICIDNEGNAYVVDAMNFRIQIFDKTGKFLSAFGEAGDMAGSMSRPKGIAIDTYGHIYVVDALFNVVQVFDRNGTLLYNFGKQGRNKGEFWMPSGIFIDRNNYIYIADNYNSRIQIFQLINGG